MTRLLLALVTSMAAIGAGAATPGQVRLLIGIMVDGLDADQLDLLRERFGQGGFRLLEQQGACLTADYGTSVDATAAAATLFSGAAPSTSGIGGDTHFNRRTLLPAPVYADTEVLGNFASKGYSPKALRVSNITDETRIASGGTNMAYTVAASPGVAIGMAGHNANSAIWLDNKSCNWSSSTSYPDMPVFVAARNRTAPLATRLDTMSWSPSLAPADYVGLPDHLTRYPFRYVFPRANADRLDMYLASPLINREVTELATEILNSQKLGQHDGVTDVLNIAYTLQPFNYGKSTDKRVEMQDAYIKLDRNLEQLFSTVGRQVGLDKTVFMLASTPPRPQRRRDDERYNMPYGEFSARKAASLLNLYLIALHGNGADPDDLRSPDAAFFPKVDPFYRNPLWKHHHASAASESLYQFSGYGKHQSGKISELRSSQRHGLSCLCDHVLYSGSHCRKSRSCFCPTVHRSPFSGLYRYSGSVSLP